jgi:hypothetical protein
MQFVGPALAGLLIVTAGPGYALAIDAVHLPSHVSLPPQSFARDLLDGWREFTARTWVWLIVVGALAAGATALRIKPRRPLLVGVIAVVPNALPIILLALELPWEILVLAALVTGFGNMLFNTLWETTLQQHVPPEALSRVSAYDWFGSLLGQPLGLALAGVVAAGIGMSRTLWIAAAVELVEVTVLLAAPSVRHLQRLDETGLEHSTHQPAVN